MANDVFVYSSDYHSVNGDTNVLETKSHHKIKCIWTGTIYYFLKEYNFTWKFNWNKLRNQGVDKLTGHIYVSNSYTVQKIDVELTENNQVITKEFGSSHSDGDVYYDYCLTPHYTSISEKPSDDEMFAPSDQNDAILIVEGKKLHVNKTFLSYHSEYFRALFSSNFKEGQMDEIPIGDVSFKDFALLLSIFHPNPVFPNDRTVEKLLEMGRRFLVPSALSSAEHHLLNMSKINDEKISFSCKISINVSVFQFLSYHSEYFRALFSSNFKEGQMDEIPIGEVSFEDFALLLRTFYPDPVFVTDATVEKLLEMARRFLVSSVIKVAEHHLLNMSKIDNQKMFYLADEYGMPTLLEKYIRGLDTLAKAKQMKKSKKYEQLSDKTKLKVFDRFMDFI
ncbi:hypothetical protein CRE_17654 [Caenorhabditis remanei]|uniref:BTB domain-containing protein n=1 Tax=Caenorhabditis remanei TaxID=31234 RepID=E3NMF2_CAERE|nr:hypothetical protein CRE_17654 [Caenorhabditis remanei]